MAPSTPVMPLVSASPMPPAPPVHQAPPVPSTAAQMAKPAAPEQYSSIDGAAFNPLQALFLLVFGAAVCGLPAIHRTIMSSMKPGLSPESGFALLLVGVAFAGIFLLKELCTSAPFISQMTIALAASVFLGYGSIFLTFWAGVA